MLKKVLPALIVMLAILHSQAQPLVTAENGLLFIGDTVSIQFVQQPFFDPGPSGANVVWDFSGLIDDTLRHDLIPVSPAATPYAETFPDATAAVAVLAPTANRDTSWFYYRNDVTEGQMYFYGTGFYTEEGNTTAFTIYQDPQLYRDYPLTLGSTFGDTFGGQLSGESGGFPIEIGRACNSQCEVDGSGTLITPAGQFNNVIRLECAEICRDSIAAIPGFVTVQRAVQYTWMAEGEKYELLSMTLVEVEVPGSQPSQSASTSYRVAGSPISRVATAYAEQIGLQISPNPTKDYVDLTCELEEASTVQVSVLNSIGQVIRRFDTLEAGTGAFSRQLDLSGIPAGQYVLQLRTKSGLASRLVIKR